MFIDPLGRVLHVCGLFVVFLSFNTAMAANGLLWYGGVFRITFVSDFVSDVSDVSCFGPSP